MVGQLLEITTQPIRLEYETQNSQLNYNYQKPVVNVTRQKGGLNISSEQVKVRIDSFEMRQSIGLKSVIRQTLENAQKAKQDGYDAISAILQQGNQLADPNGPSVAQIAKQSTIKKVDANIDFIPKERPEITVEGGTIEMSYTPDELMLDANISDIQFEFIRGKVNFEVVEMPQVNIEYIGEPNYFPPSASEKVLGGIVDINV